MKSHASNIFGRKCLVLIPDVGLSRVRIFEEDGTTILVDLSEADCLDPENGISGVSVKFRLQMAARAWLLQYMADRDDPIHNALSAGQNRLKKT